MIIDKKGKIFGKVSIVDVLVILVILAGVAGVGYKFTKSDTLSPFSKPNTIITKFYQKEDDEFAAKSIKIGDMVTDKATGATLGKVTDVKIGPAVSYASDDKGVWVQSSKPNYVSILITVEGEGIYKDGVSGQGAYFDNAQFLVNKSLELNVGNQAFWMEVYSIGKKE